MSDRHPPGMVDLVKVESQPEKPDHNTALPEGNAEVSCTLRLQRGQGMLWLTGPVTQMAQPSPISIQLADDIAFDDLRVQRVAGYAELHLVILQAGEDNGDRVIIAHGCEVQLQRAKDGALIALTQVPFEEIGYRDDDWQRS